MPTVTDYKKRLDNSSKKFRCPSCGHKTFVRMKDFDTGEYLPEHVGRCDRENNCGYHLTLKQYLTDIGAGNNQPKFTQYVAPAGKPTDFMPHEYIEASMAGYMETNFANFLIKLFFGPAACKALTRYFVGRSNNYYGKACIFWRIDSEGNVRTGKIMVYNLVTGKRVKEINPTWIHSNRPDFNFKLCFFGEHLLSEHPDKTIGIVESEKTAIIASIFVPDMVWIATGGNSGCKWREWDVFRVLKDRDVILFPDFGFYNKKTGRTCYQEWSERAEAIKERMNCRIIVSRILEDKLQEKERENDYDLADLLIKTEIPGGWPREILYDKCRIQERHV